MEVPTPPPSAAIGLRWVGLALWVVLLIAVDISSRRLGLGSREVPYLIAAALASTAVVTLFAFARLAGSPRELRKLALLAVLLPSAFVVLVELILYFIEIEDRMTEVGEHVVATAILSAGAVPFSVYIFRAFASLRDELARRAQHLQALHETSMAVTRAPTLSLLQNRICQGMRGVVSSDQAILRLRPHAGRGEVMTVEPMTGALGPWEAGLADAAETSEVPIRCCEGDRSFLGVAIRQGDLVLGVMASIRNSGPAFVVEDELLLDMFGVVASAALENAERLEEALLVATVEERERIARDLHDDLGQLLAFLTAKIQAIQELVTSGRVAWASEELSGLESASRELGAHVREAILGLRARVGPDRPLGLALEEYVAEFGIQSGLSAGFESTPDAGRHLPGSAQYQFLRIAQEALSNARRHARAQHVAVRLAESDGEVELSITDDGTGFDPDNVEAGFGLKTMEERAESLGGTFEIRSAHGLGTTVLARGPLAQE